ncbi:MAG TPA: aminotransferase class I/II-fold pyridoxal phosphate-dependent enzyme, partial [Negativicutes bacterium]|nr:aminotransferase class I/II-fold pyridoxal phosphate-dependent enzyme [Negativicutes bacterium]
HTSIASLEGMRDNTILLNGFSKAFAMTGWRLGFACGNPEIIESMMKIHQYTMLCAPITAQVAAIEALRHGQSSMMKMVEEYNRRRRLMVEGIKTIGLECFEPQGAFYIFPSVKKTGLSSLAFAEELLKAEKVALVPGDAFGACGEGFVRCSYASSTANLSEALTRIGRFVKNRL